MMTPIAHARNALASVLTAVALTIMAAAPAHAWSKLYEVHGVDEGDMLKMRAGPDTGYRVIVGLPNGTVVRVYKCESSGAVQWCKASLKEARSLVGWVSMSYLREHR
ncbi:MAG: SH3 domain-containing protein [Luteolibacter sp.]